MTLQQVQRTSTTHQSTRVFELEPGLNSMAPSLLTRARAGKRKGQFACDFVVSNSCAVPADKSFSHLRSAITRSIILFTGADERKRLIIGRSIFHPGGVFGWVRPEKDTRAQNNRKWVAPRSLLARAYHFTFFLGPGISSMRALLLLLYAQSAEGDALNHLKLCTSLKDNYAISPKGNKSIGTCIYIR